MSDTKYNPNAKPNPNPTIKQHATVSIRLNVVKRPIRIQRNSCDTMLLRLTQCCCTVFATFRCYCNTTALIDQRLEPAAFV